MTALNSADGGPVVDDPTALEDRGRRAAGFSIAVGSIALIASLLAETGLPAGGTHVEYVTHPLAAPVVALDFVALTLITLGATFLGLVLLRRGAYVSMVAALLGVGVAYVLGVVELALRGVAAPTVAERLSDPNAANSAIDTYAAFGGGLFLFMNVLHAGALALIGFAIYRSGFFDSTMHSIGSPAVDAVVGLGGVVLGVANLLIVTVEFLGLADFSVIAMPMTVLLYGYLLVLGIILLLSTRGTRQPSQGVQS